MIKKIILLAITMSSLSAICQTTNALHFDGGNDQVYIGNSPLLNVPHITVQVWVKIDYIGTYDGIITKRNCCNDFTDFQWSLQTSPNGHLSWGVNIGSPTLYVVGDPNPMDVGIWTNYTATYNGQIISMYKNGTLIAADSSRIGDITPMNWPFVIGDRDGGNDWFPGDIDEVRIWNRALTQQEIQANINCALSGSESGLIAYYDFNQGIAGGNNSSETTLFDKTSNHLDGSLQNFGLIGTTSNWTDDNISPSGCFTSASIFDKSTTEGNTATKLLKFPVILSNAYSDTVKIKYKTFNNTATAGSDYIAKQGTLSFLPGQTTKNISITINGDTQPEANESFYVRLSSAVNATIADDTAIGLIRNDDGTLIGTSVNEEIKSATGSTIKLYPNPAKDQISISGLSVAGIVRINNIAGLVVLQQAVKAGTEKLDISKLPAGTYVITYFSERSEEQLKFLKQ
ncbi:MAG TPA: Calx-beta domain-containing protein [Panacibacter sp.]|nr:Calx-beta domain-containing protein [Panacibacter sp.]